MTAGTSRRTPTRAILEQAGNCCAYPDCAEHQYLEIATIRAESPGGPRHDPNQPTGPGTANLLVLCPNHHRLVDAEPHRFSVKVLQRMRETQLARGRTAAGATMGLGSQQQALGRISGLASALQVWDDQPQGVTEEFWHRLFEDVPELLAAALPGDAVQCGSKCYVGGKTIDNANGNIVDFLYRTRSTLNATLVEIKTPGAKLVGSPYRNVFLPGSELAGSVVQAEGYRDSLLKSYYELTANSEDARFRVFNPKAMVIIGNLEAEVLNANQRRSFDLFRHGLAHVIVVTFDELFRKVRDLVSIMPPEMSGSIG